MVLLGLALGPGWFFLKTSRPQQFQLFSDRPGGRSAGGPPWKFRAGYSRAPEPSGPVPAGLGPDRDRSNPEQDLRAHAGRAKRGRAEPKRAEPGPSRAEPGRAGPEPGRARAGPGPGRAGFTDLSGPIWDKPDRFGPKNTRPSQAEPSQTPPTRNFFQKHKFLQ